MFKKYVLAMGIAVMAGAHLAPKALAADEVRIVSVRPERLLGLPDGGTLIAYQVDYIGPQSPQFPAEQIRVRVLSAQDFFSGANPPPENTSQPPDPTDERQPPALEPLSNRVVALVRFDPQGELVTSFGNQGLVFLGGDFAERVSVEGISYSPGRNSVSVFGGAWNYFERRPGGGLSVFFFPGAIPPPKYDPLEPKVQHANSWYVSEVLLNGDNRPQTQFVMDPFVSRPTMDHTGRRGHTDENLVYAFRNHVGQLHLVWRKGSAVSDPNFSSDYYSYLDSQLNEQSELTDVRSIFAGIPRQEVLREGGEVVHSGTGIFLTTRRHVRLYNARLGEIQHEIPLALERLRLAPDAIREVALDPIGFGLLARLRGTRNDYVALAADERSNTFNIVGEIPYARNLGTMDRLAHIGLNHNPTQRGGWRLISRASSQYDPRTKQSYRDPDSTVLSTLRLSGEEAQIRRVVGPLVDITCGDLIAAGLISDS